MIVPTESISLSILNHSQLFRNPNSYRHISTEDIRSYVLVERTNKLYVLIAEKKSQNIDEKWLISHLNKVKFKLKKQIFFLSLNTDQVDLTTQVFLSNELAYSSENKENSQYLSQNVTAFIKKIKLYTKNDNEFYKKYSLLPISDRDKLLLGIEQKNILKLKNIISHQLEKKYYIPEAVQKIHKYSTNLLKNEKLNDSNYIIIKKKITQTEELTDVLNLSLQTVEKRLLFFHLTNPIKHKVDIECLNEVMNLINYHQNSLINSKSTLLKYLSEHAVSIANSV